jgi:hypothetical protein
LSIAALDWIGLDWIGLDYYNYKVLNDDSGVVLRALTVVLHRPGVESSAQALASQLLSKSDADLPFLARLLNIELSATSMSLLHVPINGAAPRFSSV